MRLESEFGIAIDDEKFSTLKTVNDVYRYVTELADA
jgi:acyl carrier protein